MEKNLYKIGEVAKMFKISVSNLRHYEKNGLLVPEYIDEESGYRYYGFRQFEKLNIIKYLRVLDMPIKSIKDFLQNREVSKIQQKLIEQKKLIEKKKKELEIIERKIDRRLQDIESAVNSELDKIKIENTNSTKIAYVLNSVAPVDYTDLENSLRKVDCSQNNDPIIFSGKVGVGISQENLMSKNFSKYDIVFVILDEEDVYDGQIEFLPKCLCATISFCGTHKNAFPYYEKLFYFIKSNNLEIAGFSREITIVDNSLSDKEEQFFTKIKIPVKKRGK